MVGHEAGSDKPLVVLFCSTTMIAFGRVIHGDVDDMQAFLDWYEPQWGDPHRADTATLVERQGEWVGLRRDGVAAKHTKLIAAGWGRMRGASTVYEWIRPARDGGGAYSFDHALQLLGEEE
jgi:hypothetical protein